MILTGSEILKRNGSDIIITPFDKSKINPNSYNLTLFNELITYHEIILDMKKDNIRYEKITIPENGLELRPFQLYLGRTNEYTETYNLVPVLEGRSSIGRLGICIHITAGYGDISFKGFWTLEIFCIHPVIIYPNIDICQIYYHTIEGDTSIQYNGKYQNNEGIQISKISEDFKK